MPGRWKIERRRRAAVSVVSPVVSRPNYGPVPDIKRQYMYVYRYTYVRIHARITRIKCVCIIDKKDLSPRLVLGPHKKLAGSKEMLL